MELVYYVPAYFLAKFCNNANILKLAVRTESRDGREQSIHLRNDILHGF